MYSETEDVIRALAEKAERVCCANLDAGRREGSCRIVGDQQNKPDRSLLVHLNGQTPGPFASGKYTDRVAARVKLRLRYLVLFCKGFREPRQDDLGPARGCS